MAESTYKTSTPEERATRQLTRDTERGSVKKAIGRGEDVFGRLSQSSQAYLRQKINQDTTQWIRSIIGQKGAQSNSNNFSSDRITPKIATTSTAMPPFVEDASQGTSSASAAGGLDEEQPDSGGGGEGTTLPDGSLGDLLYWDGTGWVPLSPPTTVETQEKFFYWDSSALEWKFADTVVFTICDSGSPKEYRIPAIEVV
jgi:hypothetical protein